jgi:hypothetical protein
MRYDLSNDFDLKSARTRFDTLAQRGAIIELTEKKQRTLRQNGYLHICLAQLALHTGNTLDYVKRYYFKARCNPELFIRLKTDSITGERVKILRSSSDLTKEEMSLAIDRFRAFALQEAGIYIPSADEKEYLRQVEMEVERAKQYL